MSFFFMTSDFLPRTRGLKVKGTLILFLALGTVCLAYTVYLTTNIAAFVVLLRGYLVSNPEDPLKLRTGLANASAQPWIVAATWLAGSNSRILVNFAHSKRDTLFNAKMFLVLVWRWCCGVESLGLVSAS